MEGKEAGSVDLPEGFDKDVNDAVVHQAVVMYQANLRQGNADTKIRSEISGGNKKPFRQKGTGRARQGSSRSPLMHHGGIVFGPHPRDFGYTIPKKVRLAALRETLKARYKESSFICVDALDLKSSKTKDFVKLMKTLKVDGKKVLAVIDGASRETTLASRNIARVQLIRAIDVSALDVVKNNKILATKAAVEKILKRIQ
jgi:large subunit ribosomal protein L4